LVWTRNKRADANLKAAAMNIFYDQFSTGQVVQATGVPNATLQSWIKRNVIVAQPPEGAEPRARITGGGTPGAHRRFSFFNVMEIAIAKALLDAGFGDLENAFKAARHFAHAGRGGISKDFPARVPGCPYDRAGMAATTLVAVRGDRSTEHLWKVGTDPIPSICHELQSHEGCVLIDAGMVFDRVVTALGYDPVKVMAFAYGRAAHH
jgi:hypothetical protein